jgi:hypothetical protein
MQEHSKVGPDNCARFQSSAQDEYVYELIRKGNPPRIRVHISAAYEYTLGDYVARPREIKTGDYILVSSFGSSIASEAREQAKHDGIGLGNINELMGALNFPDVSSYTKRKT